MDRMRALIEDCCGWNRKTWADAVEFAMTTLSEDLNGCRVLEIGASDRSSLAPLFIAKGADVVCSYYKKSEDVIRTGRLQRICTKYDIASPKLQEIDIYNIEGLYDIIVMKSVLGGVCRNDDYEEISYLINQSFRSLTPSGLIITIDNGYIGMLKRLRTMFGTGGDTWTYVAGSRLSHSLANFDPKMAGFGFLNCLSASLQLGFEAEFLNDVMYFTDRLVVRLLNPTERAVFATVIRRLPTAAP